MKNLIISVFTVVFLAISVQAQIYNIAEMNTDQIRALDRQKTVVIMPGGILEQHGPYLPSYSDGYMNEWWTEQLAEAVVGKPGWSVVIFPSIPLGQSGANDIGYQPTFPGTYAVRSSTLRAVFMDLASELGEQGFKWVFVMHAHGSPEHNLMLDQAGDYFRDTYNGRMVNLFGILARPVTPAPAVADMVRKEDGMFEVHSGVDETSRLLFLRPDLISLSFVKARSYTANNMAEAVAHARSAGWPGYIGAPRHATASYGARAMRHSAGNYNALALSILEGADERSMPRLSILGFQDKATSDLLSAAKGHWAAIEKKQSDWLNKQAPKK